LSTARHLIEINQRPAAIAIMEAQRTKESSDAVLSRNEVEVAAATYLVYYGNHIAKEEEDILPLAASTLSADDWRAAAAAAPAGDDPLFGRSPKERFRELRRRISLEAA
jgi:hemerythrin-like domain-containing protein